VTSGLAPVSLINQPYYRTMISRLYNSDGSLSSPEKVMYTEYIPASGIQQFPVITKLQQMNYDEAQEQIVLFNSIHVPDKEAALYGFRYDSPLENVSALRHYRLVYEAYDKQQADSPSSTDIVKIFEYVKGAHIRVKGSSKSP
jgi:dolichyl-diphosphooligosaccharide--protein glycosyltransferase